MKNAAIQLLSFLLFYGFLATSLQAVDEFTIDSFVSISVTKGGATVFEVNRARDKLETKSPLIQATLLPAAITPARVTVDLVSGSKEIQRVHAYEPGAATIESTSGKYYINRIATQRETGDVDRLEVFLSDNPDRDVQFNIYDPALQNLFLYLFKQQNDGRRFRVEVKEKDHEIIEAFTKFGVVNNPK